MSEDSGVTVLLQGIDMVGRAISFEMKNNASKGNYEIRMKVTNNINTFHVYLTITVTVTALLSSQEL